MAMISLGCSRAENNTFLQFFMSGYEKALARRGADMKIVRDGESLLHHAISVHEVEVITLLLQFGADPSFKSVGNSFWFFFSRKTLNCLCDKVTVNPKIQILSL